jgi:NAD(P)H-hydrate epimerase
MIPVMDSGKNNSLSDREPLAQADLAECQRWLPDHSVHSHKGSNGRVVVLGGEKAMAGATCLAGWAAYIAGAGLVRVATIPENVSAITSLRPELLVSGINKVQQLKNLLHGDEVLALGPGMGQTKWSHQVFEFCLEHRQPDIIDADGLSLLAKSPDKRQGWVLTPHPGEAARLLNCRARDVQADRIAAANEIVSVYGGICVLKGHGSLITAGDQLPRICHYGNSALAVAGTGDVLTGFLAGLLAQKMEPTNASIAAVVLHACAADIHAQEQGNIGMLASDLMVPLRRLRNGYQIETNR